MIENLKRHLKFYKKSVVVKIIKLKQLNNKRVEYTFIGLASFSLLTVIVLLNQHHDSLEQRYRDCHFFAIGATQITSSCEDHCNGNTQDFDAKELTKDLSHYHRMRDSVVHRSDNFNNAYEHCLNSLYSDTNALENKYNVATLSNVPL